MYDDDHGKDDVRGMVPYDDNDNDNVDGKEEQRRGMVPYSGGKATSGKKDEQRGRGMVPRSMSYDDGQDHYPAEP
ncbi:MAG: hypothetical protein ACI8RD_008096 [Bacillariaceae sp.]|jgi:hypothetical protein